MRNGVLLLFCTSLLGCSSAPIMGPAHTAPALPVPDASAVVDGGSSVVEPSAPAPTCEEQIVERALLVPSERHAAYTYALPEIVVHARLDPVLFLTWPDERPRSAEAEALRSELEHTSHPSRDLRRFLDAHEGEHTLLREVLLSDGYLFSDRPGLAVALSSSVGVADLFDAPRLYRARDGVVDVLDHTDGGYVETDGSTATLRLNDRVSDDESTLAAPLGLDLEVVREESGALRTIPTAIGATAASFELVFPDESRRPALALLRGGRTELVCIGGDTRTLEATRTDAARFAASHELLVEAARALVEERPRFDEPSDEPEGVQEDGELRPAWTRAYLRGEDSFVYGTVEYPVFDRRGRPIPPEVCIDFLFDAWERGSGTWYRTDREAPGRTRGTIDVGGVGGVPRRNLTGLLDYTETDASIFDRYDVAPENRVALGEGAAYAHAIARTADAFREGDALIVYGLRLQDNRLHHHALLVIRSEPVTGVPMIVADNQGRPQFRSLSGAMEAAPLRSIHHRLRLVADRLVPDA